jgi:hypothetical protein
VSAKPLAAEVASLIEQETNYKNEHRTSNVESRHGVKWMDPIDFIKGRRELGAELLVASCGSDRIA